MKLNVELSVDETNNILIIKITDVVREFIYNYMYSLNTIFNINTLCIFMHNGKELSIKKSKDNYLIINENRIEIKTENSYVNQVGQIDINQLQKDLILLMYQKNYCKFKVFFMPSDNVIQNHKVKKMNITEDEIATVMQNLRKTRTKSVKFSGNDFLTKRKDLKKIPEKNKEENKLLSSELNNSLCDQSNNKPEEPSDAKVDEQSDIKTDEPSNIKVNEPSDIKVNEQSDIKTDEPSDIKVNEQSDKIDDHTEPILSVSLLTDNSEGVDENINKSILSKSLTESEYEKISKTWDLDDIEPSELEKSADGLLKSNSSELYTNYF
ncbi:hypothetical protein Catovirus_1_704 [Catovirus CTV1]|uniref:Uncharacterized protein n=1 Tax=Catovirus CTV1 TaxID=1977631 RepID=A0A1V0SAF1_9VIRU|nr:hypothetical protein Catovirus_1_704 [Catovirus CTV1]